MNQHTSHSLPQGVRRWMLAVASIVVVILATVYVLPSQAAERVSSLPFVNNFATARFKLLGTTEVQGLTVRSFGEGAVVLPDRVGLWIGLDGDNELVHIVQIGNTIYERVGDGAWEQTDNPSANVDALPISAQFNMLQKYANGILNMGSTQVGNTPVTHYQVWVSGEKALEMSGVSAPAELRDFYAKTVYKYDFWIGQGDSFVYQQNIEISTPATTIQGQSLPAARSATLMTFYDINNPNISVSAPK